ncbi:MAG: hypothetical protein JEZ06_24615 [Anaerolineaceae bacterium]|nr:hypothetical protein [Anaerolineaceae bacterium]
MKKYTFFVSLLILIILLSGCKVAATDDSPLEPTLTGDYSAQVEGQKTIAGQWEYLSVVSRCEINEGQGSVICLKVFESDYTAIENLLYEKGRDGWELSQILYTNEGSVQTFIFARLNK